MFGQNTGGGLFGQNTGGGLFGGGAGMANTGGGLFGQNTGGGLFGGGAGMANTGGGLFGQNTGGGLFGGGAGMGNTGGGLFGANTGGGLFGANTGGGLFGANTGGGLFGANTGGGLFGAGANTGGGLFGGGAGMGMGNTGGGLFGNTGGGLFGAGAGMGNTGGGLFGGNAGGGMFGNTGGGGLFGANQNAGMGMGMGGGGLFGANQNAGMGMGMGMGMGGMGMGMGAGMAGAGFGGYGAQNDAQLLFMELQKRMEELAPVLRRAAGDRMPAPGVANSTLQQSFVAYTYSFSDNPQVLQQNNAPQFNPAIHVDEAKWAQAMQNNPDQRSCFPEALVGLPALEQRIQSQQQAVEETTNALEELRVGFGNLKDHLQATSLQKLEECRRRHQKLSRQLLQVVSAVETYAVHSGAARRNPHVEAHLEDRFAQLEQTVHAPARARARVEELWVVLRGLLQRQASTSGSAVASLGGAETTTLAVPSQVAQPAARLTDAEAEKTLRLTAAQGELIEALQEELALRKRDVAQFESALARFAAVQPGTQTI